MVDSRKRHVPLVALFIETSMAFGRGLIEGIVQYVNAHGPWSIQFEERGLEGPTPKWLKGWRGDGIIARTATASLAKAIRATGRPYVELHRGGGIAVDIESDHDLVGQMAADHFLDRGLRHFGFFAFGETAWMPLRREGFVHALSARGFSCSCYQPLDRRRVALPHWDERQRVRVARWLRRLPQPIGVFCAEDVHAMRLLESCRACGLAVPEQIAILGVDNDTVVCSVGNPPLSSIDLNSRQMGYEAASLLARRMTRRSLHTTTLYTPPSHVAVRQSTDIVAIDDAEVAQAIRFIRENAHRPIHVGHVVAEVGLSRRTLERRFQQCLKRSIKAQILDAKIEAAKRLLIQTTIPIETVGKRCGVPAFKYFGQVFRREVGVTPHQFRQRGGYVY